MNIPKKLGLILALIIALVLSAGYFFSRNAHQTSHTPISINSAKVLTWDCEYSEYKPETIMIYCGDGGAYVDKIKWDSWGENGATGTGEYYKNLCEPSCADGKMVHAAVDVRLSDVTPRKGKFYLRTLDISSKDGKDFYWGESGTFNWDVMEFAEQMNWD
jgi:hypothetical protein